MIASISQKCYNQNDELVGFEGKRASIYVLQNPSSNELATTSPSQHFWCQTHVLYSNNCNKEEEVELPLAEYSCKKRDEKLSNTNKYAIFPAPNIRFGRLHSKIVISIMIFLPTNQIKFPHSMQKQFQEAILYPIPGKLLSRETWYFSKSIIIKSKKWSQKKTGFLLIWLMNLIQNFKKYKNL